MSHNLIKLATGLSLVAIPVFLFKDQIMSLGKQFFADVSNSGIYASDKLGASGGQDLGSNSEIF